jgi:hypothetical protein
MDNMRRGDQQSMIGLIEQLKVLRENEGDQEMSLINGWHKKNSQSIPLSKITIL